MIILGLGLSSGVWDRVHVQDKIKAAFRFCLKTVVGIVVYLYTI